MIKKAMELSALCNLDVIVLVRDREFDKITYYNSSKNADENEQFSLEEAIELIKSDTKLVEYMNNDYDTLHM